MTEQQAKVEEADKKAKEHLLQAFDRCLFDLHRMIYGTPIPGEPAIFGNPVDRLEEYYKVIMKYAGPESDIAKDPLRLEKYKKKLTEHGYATRFAYYEAVFMLSALTAPGVAAALESGSPAKIFGGVAAVSFSLGAATVKLGMSQLKLASTETPSWSAITSAASSVTRIMAP